jgi:hypothetical protein
MVVKTAKNFDPGGILPGYSSESWLILAERKEGQHDA